MEKKDILTVQEVMSTNVISATADMPLADAARIIAEHNFDGMPVVDKENKLVGILTEYDLISKGSAIHLPTFQLILKNLNIFKNDRSRFEKEVREVETLKVKDVMNQDPLTLPENATYEDTVAAFRDHHRVNPIPVVDRDHKVIGVVSRFDILKPLQMLHENQ